MMRASPNTAPRAGHARCSDCPIRERAVCSHCDDSEIARLDAIKVYRDVAAGRDLMSAGEDCAQVGSIVRGVVKLTKSLPDGRAQMVGLLFPGDFVGHPTRRIAEHDATAATDVTLCLFQRAPFEAMLRDVPHLEARLLELTLGELDVAREWLLLLGRKTARERVASFLLMLLRRNPDHDGAGPAQVALPLNRGEIAAYLGLTIETVSRHMTRLRADGVIDFDNARAVSVTDPEELMAAAGD